MNADYLLLNAVFILPLAIMVIVRRDLIAKRHALRTFAIMCVLTLLFDNLMIAVGIMAYDPAHILGLKLGLAPIEDFAYTLAAVLFVSLCWNKEEKR